MPDRSKKFHEFALKTGLFKGRPDWYFCYLKAERIAHVLSVLSTRSDSSVLKDVLSHAQSLPGDIARMAAGEFDPSALVAEVFALLASVRVACTQGSLHPDTASVLVHEFEQLAQRLVAGSNPSPFISSDDFLIPELPPEPLPLSLKSAETAHSIGHLSIKDIGKGQETKATHKGQNPRTSLIIEYIRRHKGASIKDIASTVHDVSEKTIQRELNDLIRQGLVRRNGTRRWSTYELN